MRRPNGKPVDDAAQSSIAGTTNSEDVTSTTSRMVDFSLGLKFKEEQHNTVKAAFEHMPDYEHSLNQSLSWISDLPLIADIELKKLYQPKDPAVQMAIWMAGAHSKRLYHGWDTSIPLPGIVVAGSSWFYYVAFHRGNGLVRLNHYLARHYLNLRRILTSI